MQIFRFVFLSFPEVALGMGIAAKPGHVTLRVFFFLPTVACGGLGLSMEDRLHILGLCSATPELLLLKAKARHSFSAWIWTSRAETEGSRDTPAGAGTLVAIRWCTFVKGTHSVGHTGQGRTSVFSFQSPALAFMLNSGCFRTMGELFRLIVMILNHRKHLGYFFLLMLKGSQV